MPDWSEERIAWEADGRNVELGLTRTGSDPVMLMLPALSSVSTRNEMRDLQAQLARTHTTIAVDWPGFGDLPRPKIDWRPQLYRDFLRFLITRLPRIEVTLAAGHAASYTLAQSAESPDSLGRLILLAPTWRGPLPTMASRRLPAFKALSKAVDIPGIGRGFYRLNVNGPVINMMLGGHVYQNKEWLTPERLAAKRLVTEAPGARYASFRFVSGELDLFHHQSDVHDTARRAGADIAIIYGRNTPRKSKAEMIALAELPNIQPIELPRGKLSFYEEFPEDAFDAISTILTRQPSAS